MKKKRKFSAKQIRAGFGGKRRQAALKHRHTAKKRNPPRHAKRAAPKKRAVARHTKRKTSHRSRTVKRNPELVSFLLGNPAKRSTKKMAKTKKRAVARHSKKNAGTRRRRTTHVTKRRHSSRRGNPGGIPLRDFAYGGVGVLGGFLGSAAIPQLFLGAKNTGMVGYGVTAAAVIGLTILTHIIFPRQRALTFGVGAGGAANFLRRIITDQTPFGSYLSNMGMGDYMVANWGPPRMTDGMHSAMAELPGTPWGGGGSGIVQSSAISAGDMADIRSARPC